VAQSPLGEIAFIGYTATGAGLYNGPDPVANKIIAVGDPLDGSTVAGLTLSGDAINTSGSVAFEVNLADGREAIYRADPPPLTATVNTVAAFNGSTGTTNFTFTVALNQPAAAPVSIAYATADGTAHAGSDYAATSGTVMIPVGQSAATIVVPVYGTTTVHPDLTFALNLSNPVNALLSNTQATGMIRNANTQVLVGNASQTVGTSGSYTLNVPVTLSAPAPFPVSVNYATADGTARAGSDYIAKSGTLTIPAGQTSGTINVTVFGEKFYRPSLSFGVNLSGPTNALITTGTATATMVETPPTLSISNVSLAEPAAGRTKAMTFKVTLSSYSQVATTVKFATADGTATVADGDYNAATGTLTIPAWTLSGSVNVTIVGGAETSPASESYAVILSAPTTATIKVGTATGTILNKGGNAPVPVHGGAKLATVDAPATVRVTSAAATVDDTALRRILGLEQVAVAGDGQDQALPVGMRRSPSALAGRN
jgi:hypothetical protein